MKRIYAGSGEFFRLIAACVWILLLAATLLPLSLPSVSSMVGTCAMACCRLQAHAAGERCICCGHDGAPTGDDTVNCSCRIGSHVAALAPLPPVILAAALDPTQWMDPGSYDACESIVQASGFVPTPYRPPNSGMI